VATTVQSRSSPKGGRGAWLFWHIARSRFHASPGLYICVGRDGPHAAACIEAHLACIANPRPLSGVDPVSLLALPFHTLVRRLTKVTYSNPHQARQGRALTPVHYPSQARAGFVQRYTALYRGV